MERDAVHIRKNSFPSRSRGFDTRTERSTLHLPNVTVRSKPGALLAATLLLRCMSQHMAQSGGAWDGLQLGVKLTPDAVELGE
jgi:hypothetical protein